MGKEMVAMCDAISERHVLLSACMGVMGISVARLIANEQPTGLVI